MFSILKQARLDKKLTLRQVESATGIPRSTIQRIETGARAPTRAHARTLYKYYNYQIDLADIYDPTFDVEVSKYRSKQPTKKGSRS